MLKFIIFFMGCLLVGLPTMVLAEDLKPPEKVVPGPNDKPKEESKGHFLISLAGVYSANINGVVRPEKPGKFFPLAVLFEIGANDNIGFETGVIFTERQYLVVNDNYQLQQRVKRFHIPVTVKLWWRDTIAISAGPYASIAASGVDSEKWIRVADTNNLKTPADDTFEFGFESALTLNLSLSEKTGVFIEGRYYAPYDEVQFKKYNSLYGLIGVKIQWR